MHLERGARTTFINASATANNSSLHSSSNLTYPLPDLPDLFRHGGYVSLSPEPWVDCHYENVVNEVKHILDHLCRSVRIECDRRRTTGSANAGEGTVKVCASFDMDDHDARLAVWAFCDLGELCDE